MKKLYFDMNSGISGDMTLAVLLQLSDQCHQLSELISSIFKTSIKLNLKDKFVNGILCKQLDISITNEPHIHRDFKSIKSIIESAPLDEKVKNDAIAIFHLIAESEAKIHGSSIDYIHFHEVGALDSIIDILGTAYVMNKIGQVEIYSSPAKLGHGLIKSAHGLIPIPAPATADILSNFPIERIDIPEELTTPTGAAILKHYVKKVTYTFRGVIKNCYYSTGTKEFKKIPNILRLFEIEDNASIEQLVLLETNIDDMSGEPLGDIMELLFSNGALDTFFTPIFMKKNRPAIKLSVLCNESQKENLINIILKYTTSAGIRYININRIEMDRTFHNLKFQGEEFRVKRFKHGDIVKYSIEWEDIKKISKKFGISSHQLYHKLMKMVEESEL
ncbi:MAG: nickel pincer cofactor biosynthesis protein LarC [Deferribacterales bacterium]